MNSLNQKRLPIARPIGLDHIGSAQIIRLPERCDVHTTLHLSVRFDGPGQALVLDGSMVAFADTHTLQAWVDTRLKALDRDCDIVICNPSDELRATLELTGFDALLPMIGIDSRADVRVNSLTLSGVLGPSRLSEVEAAISERLLSPRPQLEIRLVDVEAMHLGMVNVLIKARTEARKRLGDVNVIVDRDSDAERMLAAVGIIGTLRP